MIAIRTMTEMPKTCEECRLKQVTVTLYGHMLSWLKRKWEEAQ